MNVFLYEDLKVTGMSDEILQPRINKFIINVI